MRTTLTKSLHTVTAVSNLAAWVLNRQFVNEPENAVAHALSVLGQPGPWKDDDPTVVACIKAVERKVA